MPKALITGASSGLGKTFAYELAKQGYSLTLVARREEKLKEIKQDLEKQFNISVEYLVQDLSTSEGVKTVCDTVKDIDLLINNAGFGKVGKFTDIDIEKESNMIDLNIKTLYHFTKIYGLRMAKEKAGGIINIASTAAFQPIPGFAIYSATKAFVLSFSEAISEELKPYGVHIMTLCPGPTSTEFFDIANSGSPMAMKFRTMMCAEDVIKEGLKAFKKGKRTYIAGRLNKAIIRLGHFTPKGLIFKVLAKSMKLVTKH